jgi:hypothetical protein
MYALVVLAIETTAIIMFNNVADVEVSSWVKMYGREKHLMGERSN